MLEEADTEYNYVLRDLRGIQTKQPGPRRLYQAVQGIDAKSLQKNEWGCDRTGKGKL